MVVLNFFYVFLIFFISGPLQISQRSINSHSHLFSSFKHSSLPNSKEIKKNKENKIIASNQKLFSSQRDTEKLSRLSSSCRSWTLHWVEPLALAAEAPPHAEGSLPAALSRYELQNGGTERRYCSTCGITSHR